MVREAGLGTRLQDSRVRRDCVVGVLLGFVDYDVCLVGQADLVARDQLRQESLDVVVRDGTILMLRLVYLIVGEEVVDGAGGFEMTK